jgi:hypothetical protein
LGEEAEDDTHVQLDEASQSGLNSGEQKSSEAELEATAVHAGSIGTSSERMMDPATMGATASTLKFRGAVSHEGISS